MKIVFIHGWGADSSFWQPLIEVLGSVDTHTVDLGFTGNHPLTDVPYEPALYVTHSLGTLYALKHHADKMAGLMAINGFSCFYDLVDEQVLHTMRLGLSKNAAAQMRSFYRAAEMGSPGALHKGRLEEGLGWLASLDMRESLENLLKKQGVQVKALLGGKDKIVPAEKAALQWEEHILLPNAGHNLPQKQAEWCVGHIKDIKEKLG